MEYSFLATRLSLTFDVHIYIFHGKPILLLLPSMYYYLNYYY